MSIWPNFGLGKQKFPLIWCQKLCKVGKRVIFVEALGKELSSNYILELSYLKNHANHLIYLFIIYSKNNIAKEPALIKSQKFVLGNIVILGIQKPYKRSKLPEYIHQAKIEREAKKIF